MKTMKTLAVVLGVAYALGLGGCAGTGRPGAGEYTRAIPSGGIPAGNGVIRAIAPVRSGGDLLRFTIRMNSGEVHTLRHEGRAGFRVGDRVRIRGGMMERM